MITQGQAAYAALYLTRGIGPAEANGPYVAGTYSMILGLVRICQQAVNQGVNVAGCQAAIDLVYAYLAKCQQAGDDGNKAQAVLLTNFLKECLATPAWLAIEGTGKESYRLSEAYPLGLLAAGPTGTATVSSWVLVKMPYYHYVIQTQQVPLGITLPDGSIMAGPAGYAIVANLGNPSAYSYYGSLEHPKN